MPNKKEREDKERWDAFQKECDDNLAKGLTRYGYTKKFDGESIELYINNRKMVATVSYEICGCPHLEFKGEPCPLTETGYRSCFLQTDIKGYGILQKAVEGVVTGIMKEEQKRGLKYTLTCTWEPSLDYLAHSPEQLTLFAEGATVA